MDEDKQIDEHNDSTEHVTDEKEESGDVEPPLLDWKSVVKDMMNEELVKNILIRFAETRTDIRQEMMSMASEDITTRKLFVRGLAWSISDAELSSAFESFGPIEEAVVVCVLLTLFSHSLTHEDNDGRRMRSSFAFLFERDGDGTRARTTNDPRFTHSFPSSPSHSQSLS